MPHFPNYRLGTTPTYPCDPTIELPVALTEIEKPNLDFTLSPNPTSGTLNLELPEEVRSITITNTLGQVVKRWEQMDFPYNWVVQDLDLAEGIYYCTVETEWAQGTRAFVVIC